MTEFLVFAAALLFLVPILAAAWGKPLWHLLWPCLLAFGLLWVFG